MYVYVPAVQKEQERLGQAVMQRQTDIEVGIPLVQSNLAFEEQTEWGASALADVGASRNSGLEDRVPVEVRSILLSDTTLVENTIEGVFSTPRLNQRLKLVPRVQNGFEQLKFTRLRRIGICPRFEWWGSKENVPQQMLYAKYENKEKFC